MQGLPAVQCAHDDRQDRELQRDSKKALQPPPALPPFPANDHVVRIPRAAHEPPEVGHVPRERHEIFARRAVALVVRLAVVPDRPSKPFLHPRIVLCARFFADREGAYLALENRFEQLHRVLDLEASERFSQERPHPRN